MVAIVDEILKQAMPWDVMGGVARRAWARNPHSIETVIEYNNNNKGTDHITLPYITNEDFIKKLVEEYPDYLFVSPIHSFSSESFTVSILSLTSWSSEIVSPAFTLLICSSDIK